VREVVRAVIRPLIAEFRGALKLFKSATREKKAETPFFVKAKTGFGSGPKPVKVPLAPISQVAVPKITSPGAQLAKPFVRATGAFDFDYSSYAKKEQSRVEWRKLSVQLNSIVAQTVHVPIGEGKSRPPNYGAADVRIRNLLFMHVKDFGDDALLGVKGEIDVLIGRILGPTLQDKVVSVSHTGFPLRTVSEMTGPPLFPETASFLKKCEDSRPSEVLALWFGANQ
jgi:hypothetical protein